MASAARFLASGGFNTLVTYLAYLALLQWLPYRESYSIAFASGIALAYFLNRYYVFRRPGGSLGPVYVALIYVGQYLLGLLIVSAWVDWLGGPATVAPLVAIAISLPLTYLCNAVVFGDASGAQNAGDGNRRTMRATWLPRAAFACLVGLPVLSIVLNLAGWLRSGFDLPFFDDWRAYGTGQIDSLDPDYLFTGINDTIAPIGFALDAIAQRLIAGNSVAYQAISMVTVLGLLLFLQWKLLRAALATRMEAAACFVLTLLMLQPGSYWGRENLAYHQAVPLLFLLTALWLIAVSRWKNVWRLPPIFALGLLAGLTYISGAFGALAGGCGVIAVALLALPRGPRFRMVAGGATLAVAGAIMAGVQYKIALVPTMRAGYRGDARLALPYEHDFWVFLMGKVGRSLLLPESHPIASLLLALLACGIAVAAGIFLVRRLRANPQGLYLQLTVIYGALVSIILVYLCMVAAGRTYLRTPEVVGSIDVFLMGFQRFHFFWAALLWPWVAAAGIALVRGAWAPAWRTAAGVFVCAGGIILMTWGGALGHFERHRLEASYRIPTISCLMGQLQKGEGIDCAEFNMADLTPAYIYAHRIGASFVRYFPVLPIDLGVDDPAPWFRLSRDRARVVTQNVTTRPDGYLATPDPQFHIQLGRPDEMDNCVMLDVTAVVDAARDDILRVYFRRRGEQKFSEESSQWMPVQGREGPKVYRFRIESDTGFGDMLRVDPVEKGQVFGLPEVEVRCRLRYSTRPFFKLPEPPHSPYLVDSAWLDPIPAQEHAYRAGQDGYVTFLTAKPLQMSECSVLHVEMNLAVKRKARAQLYYLPRGHRKFTEELSVSFPVEPAENGLPKPIRFRLESAIGFEDKLRFDPVDNAQDVRISELRVSCFRRLSSAATQTARAGDPEKAAR